MRLVEDERFEFRMRFKPGDNLEPGGTGRAVDEDRRRHCVNADRFT